MAGNEVARVLGPAVGPDLAREPRPLSRRAARVHAAAGHPRVVDAERDERARRCPGVEVDAQRPWRLLEGEGPPAVPADAANVEAHGVELEAVRCLSEPDRLHDPGCVARRVSEGQLETQMLRIELRVGSRRRSAGAEQNCAQHETPPARDHPADPDTRLGDGTIR